MSRIFVLFIFGFSIVPMSFFLYFVLCWNIENLMYGKAFYIFFFWYKIGSCNVWLVTFCFFCFNIMSILVYFHIGKSIIAFVCLSVWLQNEILLMYNVASYFRVCLSVCFNIFRFILSFAYFNLFNNNIETYHWFLNNLW